MSSPNKNSTTKTRKKHRATASPTPALGKKPVAPGKTSRSVHLSKPDHAVGSGLTQKAATPDAGTQAVDAGTGTPVDPVLTLELFTETINGFSAEELNEATKTIFGELSITPHEQLSTEAYNVASEIFNRKQHIDDTRKELAEAQTKLKKAQSEEANAQAEFKKADAEFNKISSHPSVRKQQIRESLVESAAKETDSSGKDGGDGGAAESKKTQVKKDTRAHAKDLNKAVDQQYDEEWTRARASRDSAQHKVTETRAARGKAETAVTNAGSANIAAESFIDESKRGHPFTLSDIVSGPKQFDGHGKGTADFNGFSKFTKGQKAWNKLRWDTAKQELQKLAQTPWYPAPFLYNYSNSDGKRHLRANEVRVGGNDFSAKPMHK